MLVVGNGVVAVLSGPRDGVVSRFSKNAYKKYLLQRSRTFCNRLYLLCRLYLLELTPTFSIFSTSFNVLQRSPTFSTFSTSYTSS